MIILKKIIFGFDIDEKIFKNKIFNNKDYDKQLYDIKIELLKTKYIDDLLTESNEFFEYKLDFDSYYELFKSNEQEFMNIIKYNDLIDDYTFGSYNLDNYEFLNCFNEEVKTYLKNKIYADTNHITREQKHTPITNLDNYIEYQYFTYNPPSFLRYNGLEYYPEYFKIMDKYVSDFGYDLNKINYHKYKTVLIQE